MVLKLVILIREIHFGPILNYLLPSSIAGVERNKLTQAVRITL